jgi:hypothetical protein
VADIRDDQVWNERRWRWDGHGYSNAFPKKITPSDIDMIVERRGYFLAAETKEWRPGMSDDPFFLPRGQQILLNQLAAQAHWTVLYIAGEAADSSPWHIQHLGGTAVKDLTGIESSEHRREVLYAMFETWAQWVEAQIAALPDDARITIVDCHI